MGYMGIVLFSTQSHILLLRGTIVLCLVLEPSPGRLRSEFHTSTALLAEVLLKISPSSGRAEGLDWHHLIKSKATRHTMNFLLAMSCGCRSSGECL